MLFATGLRSYSSAQLALAVFCATFLWIPMSAVGQSVGRMSAEPARPVWMMKDQPLQALVTMDAESLPLRSALSELKRLSGVTLDTEQSLKEYRVSIHVKGQPLASIMGRIQDLFAHGNLPNDDYVWVRDADSKPVSYHLYMNAHGREKEAAMLGLPHAKAMQWVKDIRDFCALPAEKRKTFKSDCLSLLYYIRTGDAYPTTDPITETVASLTDAQIETLFADGVVQLPDFKLSDKPLSYLQQVVPQGSGVAPSFNDYAPPSKPFLTVTEEKDVDTQGAYTLRLAFNAGFPRYCPLAYNLDTLHQFPNMYSTALPKNDGPQIDLMPEIAKSGLSQNMSIANALHLLARSAHVNIYGEVFLKGPRALSHTVGNTEFLLTSMCMTYGCDWRKIGDDYLVYSRAWAQDRYADIPQPLIDTWTTNYKTHGNYELSDLIGMATLRDPQVRNAQELMSVYRLTNFLNLSALRLLGTLSPTDVRRAHQPGGIEVTTLDETQNALAKKLFQRPVSPPLHVALEYIRKVRGNQPETYIQLMFSDQSGPVQAEAYDHRMPPVIPH